MHARSVGTVVLALRRPHGLSFREGGNPMKYRKLPGTDLEVSEVCLGTMTWGEQNTESEAHAQLDYALAQGVNVIDTAEMYPVPPNATTQGRTERFIGNWLARRGRNGLVIRSKVAGPGH